MGERRGKFIVVEGIGGCGKGTQLKLAEEWLIGTGRSVLTGSEHCIGTPTGDLIEDIIKRRKPMIDPAALQMLYTADRINHVFKVIKPGLENCDVFLEDRYRGSTVAYAPDYLRGIFYNLNEEMTIRPDLVIIIDTDPDVAAGRVAKRGDGDIFDTAGRLKKCRDGYIRYANITVDSCVWVDGSGTADEVFCRVKKEIEKVLV